MSVVHCMQSQGQLKSKVTGEDPFGAICDIAANVMMFAQLSLFTEVLFYIYHNIYIYALTRFNILHKNVQELHRFGDNEYACYSTMQISEK